MSLAFLCSSDLAKNCLYITFSETAYVRAPAVVVVVLTLMPAGHAGWAERYRSTARRKRAIAVISVLGM